MQRNGAHISWLIRVYNIGEYETVQPLGLTKSSDDAIESKVTKKTMSLKFADSFADCSYSDAFLGAVRF